MKIKRKINKRFRGIAEVTLHTSDLCYLFSVSMVNRLAR